MLKDRKRIIVVCTGNTCRSPMGERLLAHALAAEPPPLNELEIVSAGVAAFGGDAPSEYAVRALEKVGLDLSDHRSRRFDSRLAEDALLILAMRSEHKDQIDHVLQGLDVPVILFREPMGGADDEVPDPFGGDLSAYTEVRDSIAESVPHIIRYIRSLLETNEKQ